MTGAVKFVALGLSLSLAVAQSSGAVEKVPLKTGWKFVKADDPAIAVDHANYSNEIRRLSAILDRATRGDLSGAPETDWCKPGFDDSAWTEVRVPHDWGVMKPYDPDLPYGDGFLDVSGIGWYRKEFQVEGFRLKAGGKIVDIPEDGKVLFECDGAMSYSMVWINGRFVGGWPYGYTRFRLDLTPYLDFGGRNVLAVRCHNIPHSSRWYTGGGLYRNCRLLVCPADYVIPGSVFITTPEITRDYARVRVRYEMSKGGKKERSFRVENPHLWDIDDPYLYEIDVEGNTYRYGIRTISFNADERRFQLNGRTVPLNGVSMHHDFGVLGAAWNRTAQKLRLLKFKEAGVNAIRSSHNPPEEELLELCDELGILVKDEVFDEWRMIGDAGKRKFGYTNIFDAWHERDVRAWVRVDRNHPSVILYSVGNEICDLKPWTKNLEGGVRTMRELVRITAQEDPTRPACNANNAAVNFTNGYPMVAAVMGCNYSSWQSPRFRELYPDVPYFYTESICMGSTRGYYRFPVIRRYANKMEVRDMMVSSYCWDGAGWGGRVDEHAWAVPPDVQWYWMDRAGGAMGEFEWTGVDYLGGPYWCDDLRRNPNFTDPERQSRALEEVKQYGLTRDALHTCDTGFIDQANFEKDAFYLFQSRWLPEKPMAHILPHWTWPGREGEVTPVYVFTSGDEGELFLNGRSLGRQRKRPGVWDRAYRLRWDDVRYAPGTLEVVVYRDGREWARDVVKTAGRPAALRAEAVNGEIVSDGEDVAYVNVSVIDAEGNAVPTAGDEISFAVEGEGVVVATDSGFEGDMSDFRLSNHRAFNGRVLGIVRAKEGSAGTLKVTVSASGLESASVRIDVGRPSGQTAGRLGLRNGNI